MKVLLAPSWELSDEHAASNYGQPVLVHLSTGRTFGPSDLVCVHPSNGVAFAAHVVARLAKTETLNAEDRALVARFIESLPPR